MCGIIGIWAKNNRGQEEIPKLPNALNAIKHRGPDNQSRKMYSRNDGLQTGLGHCRLSVIDPTDSANQPFTDPSGRYSLIYNGEIYNYKTIRSVLKDEGINFTTDSDTEVLLHLLIKKGIDGIESLNGFFSFGFYDSEKEELILARDRMGIKPLILYEDDDKYIFASELAGLFSFDINKTIDQRALNHFFSLTYIPAPETILENARSLMPGEYVWIHGSTVKSGSFTTKSESKNVNTDYKKNVSVIQELLAQSVSDRLISDVPIGSFLSGGVDSSIIASIAAEQKPDLETFSLGFDHSYFDESDYSEKMAKHIGSKHTAFTLSKEDFTNNFDRFLDALSEPFADSSAFAMFLLSERTRKNVKVSLSGDGADELFGGYRKHLAEMQLRTMGPFKKAAIKFATGFLSPFPEGRDNRFGEFNRKLRKFSNGMRLPDSFRYWQWCSFIDERDRQNLLKQPIYQGLNIFENRSFDDLNDVLLADQDLVLPNDMLKKVDLMSMAHSLEVRTPFLDHRLVDFVNNIPREHKIANGGKKILKEAFAKQLPDEILNRKKSGFEIPIREWLGEEIEERLNAVEFQKEYLIRQGIFNPLFIEELKIAWKNPRFGDKIYLVWALLIFQSWWKKYMD